MNNQLPNDYPHSADATLMPEVDSAINPPNFNNAWVLNVDSLLSTEPESAQIGSSHAHAVNFGPATTDVSDSHNIFDLNCRTPTWLVGDDLNLDALNASILSSIGYLDSPGLGAHSTEMPGVRSPQQLFCADQTPSVEDLVRENWFTYIKIHDSGTTTPEYAPKDIHIDDAYRDRLASKLQRSLPVYPLPSTDFLVHPPYHLLA